MWLFLIIVLFFGLGWSGILASIFCSDDTPPDNRWIVWIFGIVPTALVCLFLITL